MMMRSVAIARDCPVDLSPRSVANEAQHLRGCAAVTPLLVARPVKFLEETL